MSRELTTIAEVERLLKELGVATPPPVKRPLRSPWRRFVRRLYLRLIVLLLCAVVALAAALTCLIWPVGDPPGPPATGHDPRFGVVEALSLPALATRLGVGWERIGLPWQALQPTGPDSWNPFVTNHDAGIDAELAAGRHLAAVLINTPDWAAAQPGLHTASPPSGLYLPWDDPHNYWGHFVNLVVKRYAGRIDDWIIWNEISIPSGQWNTWKGSVDDYAQLIKVAYLAARDANPQARIVLGGDPYWYDHGRSFAQVLRRLTEDPASRPNDSYFDVVNLHLYSAPSNLATVTAVYRSIMARFGLHKPIWVSETNATPYDDPVRLYRKGNFYATEDDQASYIIQAYAIGLAVGLERIEVNRMVDGVDFVKGGTPSGLVRNDGTVRPAFWAYRTAVDLFSGVTGGSQHLDRASGVYTVVLHRPGATITVLWDQQPVPVRVTLPAQGRSATVYDKFDQGHVVQDRQGSFVFNLAGATDNTNDINPRDYPIGGNPVIVVQTA